MSQTEQEEWTQQGQAAVEKITKKLLRTTAAYVKLRREQTGEGGRVFMEVINGLSNALALITVQYLFQERDQKEPVSLPPEVIADIDSVLRFHHYNILAPEIFKECARNLQAILNRQREMTALQLGMTIQERMQKNTLDEITPHIKASLH